MHKMMCDLPNDPEVKHAFTNQRNKVKSLIRNKKRQHLQSRFDQSIGDPKVFHRNLNEVFDKVEEPILPTFDDEKTLDDFNKFSALVDIRNREFITPTSATFNMKDQEMSLFMKPTNENEVSCTIETKNTSMVSAVSYWSFCFPAILHAITTLYNRFIRQGFLPDRLKVAINTRYTKKGYRENFVKYRPVSLLPCISKVFENVIYARLINYVEKFDLLSHHQYGHRKKRSTIDTLTNNIEQIRCASVDEKPTLHFLRPQESFWYHRSLFIIGKAILPWHPWSCLWTAQIISHKHVAMCLHQRVIYSDGTNQLWCATRFCTWRSALHHLYRLSTLCNWKSHIVRWRH